MIKICVIDGQGGGIGGTVIKKLKNIFNESVEIIALGTNAIATSNMLKAKANKGASGENAIVQTVKDVDFIIGPISILLANAMMGEITPKIAESISSSSALKLMLPLSQENIQIIGMPQTPLPQLVDKLIKDYLSDI